MSHHHTLSAAIVTYLLGDQTDTPSAWPTETVNGVSTAATVRRDPRLWFLDEITAPAVRVHAISDGPAFALAGNSSQSPATKTVRILVGFARRVDSLAEFNAGLEWGQRLFDLLDGLGELDEWSHSRPGEWVYEFDEESLNTRPDGELCGHLFGLFATTWVG
jgi:hypothetical protein